MKASQLIDQVLNGKEAICVVGEAYNRGDFEAILLSAWKKVQKFNKEAYIIPTRGGYTVVWDEPNSVISPRYIKVTLNGDAYEVDIDFKTGKETLTRIVQLGNAK